MMNNTGKRDSEALVRGSVSNVVAGLLGGVESQVPLRSTDLVCGLGTGTVDSDWGSLGEMVTLNGVTYVCPTNAVQGGPITAVGGRGVANGPTFNTSFGVFVGLGATPDYRIQIEPREPMLLSSLLDNTLRGMVGDFPALFCGVASLDKFTSTAVSKPPIYGENIFTSPGYSRPPIIETNCMTALVGCIGTVTESHPEFTKPQLSRFLYNHPGSPHTNDNSGFTTHCHALSLGNSPSAFDIRSHRQVTPESVLGVSHVVCEQTTISSLFELEVYVAHGFKEL
ncbi:hypothetical protein Pelo_7994 [Pelomyxa schiedti]|nr:hypothetical protein Pelo_7994 [Pelomyxa schiedti]